MTVHRERIPWHPSDDGGPLGRNVNHDPRSWNYRVPRTATAIRSVTHYRRVPVYDQGNLGSCVAHALKGTLSTRPFGHRFTSERLIIATYSQLTAMDDIPGTYPPDDTGSDGLSAAKLAAGKGWCQPTYQHAMGIDDAVDALMRAPVLTGTDWYESMDRPDSDGLVGIGGQIRGGHEYSVVGYRRRGTTPNYDEDLILCVNSWGSSWGRRGRFYLTVATWARLLDQQGDVTVLNPK